MPAGRRIRELRLEGIDLSRQLDIVFFNFCSGHWATYALALEPNHRTVAPLLSQLLNGFQDAACCCGFAARDGYRKSLAHSNNPQVQPTRMHFLKIAL